MLNSEPPSAGIEPRTWRVEISLKTVLWVTLAVAASWALLRLFTVLLVLVVALFLVGTLNPLVDWLERRRFKRPAAIALTFGGLLLSGAGLLALAVPTFVEQLRTLALQEPTLRLRLAELLGGSPLTYHLAEALRHARYDSLAQWSLGTALQWSTRAVEFIAYALSSVFLALYIMLDRDRLRGGLYASVPRRYHIRLSRVLLNLETIVGGYIRGQALTSLLMALVVGALLGICRVPNALALAVFGGLADVLPYIGVFLTVGPAALAASTHGVGCVLLVVGVLLAYEEIEARFLVPHIYGRVLRLPSSIVLLALLIGTALMGILGALLALPAAAAVRMLVEELRVTLPGEQIPNSRIRADDLRAEWEYERRTEGVPAEEAAAIAIEISNGQREAEGGPMAAAEAALDPEHADIGADVGTRVTLQKIH